MALVFSLPVAPNVLVLWFDLFEWRVGRWRLNQRSRTRRRVRLQYSGSTVANQMAPNAKGIDLISRYKQNASLSLLFLLLLQASRLPPVNQTQLNINISPDPHIFVYIYIY